LEYNIETMRITDAGEDSAGGSGSVGFSKPATSILNQIKTTTTVNDALPRARDGFDLARDAGTPPGSSVESSKLKQMLAGLKAKSE
jgi:hypothetical protein